MVVSVKANVKHRIRCTPGVDVTQRIKAVYEGASQKARMGQKGLMGISGPNGDIASGLRNLRKRSRHAVQNNPYATKAKETYKSNLVGNGIRASWPDERVQKLWDVWVNQADADGLDNFYSLQDLAAGAQFESGEVLVRRRPRRLSDGLAVPLQLELVEGDLLDEGFHRPGKFDPVVMGIQFNAYGQRTHYHLWQRHPGDILGSALGNVRRPVPASDVIHLFRRLRPGQHRGVPEFAPVLIRLYEIDEMQDSTLVKQKTAQLFAWIIKKRQDLSGHVESDDVVDGLAVGESALGPDGEQLTKVVPGGIHYLDDDEEISFSTPDGIGSNYSEWLRTELRAVAVGVGLTYEQLTGDLTGVNYSSIRAGLLEFRRRIEQLQLNLLVHRFCHKVAEWFADTVVMMGLVDLPGYWQKPWEYLPKWKPPKWEWVDPLKDAMADLIEVRSGMSTLANKHVERGLDTEEVVAQLCKEQAWDLTLDSNPSKVSKSGVAQDTDQLAGALLSDG